MKLLMCVSVCVKLGGRGRRGQASMSWENGFTVVLCLQFVLAPRVLMSPPCSQCGEEGGSVHGRRVGGQSRQSAGEPAGQWRYGHV